MTLGSLERSIQFDEYKNLTDNDEDSVYGQVATVGDNAYVVWQESVPGESNRNYDIFFQKSHDNGNSFGKEINLSNNKGFSEHPQISGSGDGVYVVWADDTNQTKQVMFKKSNNAGDSFGKEIILSNPKSSSYNQETAAFGSSVYVVWLEKVLNGPYRVMLASSTDRGITFAEPKVLSEDATVQTFPKVSAFDEHVYVSWNVDDEGPMTDGGVFFLASADNGATFSNVTKLSRDEKDFGEAQVASYADRVYVIWGGSTSNKVESLFLVSSEDNGKTFDDLNVLDQTKLSNVRSPSNVEMIANGTNQLYIAWQDHIQTSEKDEILFSSSNNGGLSFDEVTNLSNNIDISECPSIVTNGKMVYVTWEDLTPGNHEVFYTHSNI